MGQVIYIKKYNKYSTFSELCDFLAILWSID